MKNKILQCFLLAMTVAMGFCSWFSVWRAVKIPGSSTWAVPMAFFMLYAIFLCLTAVLVSRGTYVNFAATISMLFSLIFAQSLWHLAILALCILLMLSALHKIRKDLKLNVKVSLWKSLGTGKFSLVLALAILVSSQYFFIIKNMDGQKNIPKFDVSAVSSQMVGPILEMMNPDFKKIQDDGLTVDQFIIESQKQNEQKYSIDESVIDQQIPTNLPAKQREALKQQALGQLADQKTQIAQNNSTLVLQEGRKQLSQMTGQEIGGSEKIADVFSGLIDKKINDFFQYKLVGDQMSFLLEYIFTAILFLTVWPLGSILCSLCFLAAVIIFKILVACGLVEIKKEMVEREAIA